MRENWHEALSNWMLKGLPLFVSILWLMVSVIPLRSETGANARPLVGVMCVYFWTVFLLGLISDIMSIAPFGIHLFLYLIMFLLVTNLVKYITEKTFEILWIGLALLLPAVMFAGWLMMSMYYACFLPLKGMFFSYLLSVVLYPVVGGINALTANICLQDDSL